MMIWKLLLAHVINDFLLQTKAMAESKSQFRINILHCFILFVISTAFFVNQLSVNLVLMLIAISLLHGIIDLGKASLESRINSKSSWLLFLIDQLMHILIIFFGLYLFFSDEAISILAGFQMILDKINLLKTAVFLVVISFGGSYFTAAVCKGFKPAGERENSLDRAGRYIGILERLIVAASILIGRYEIIGFLIAAKSIIRHHENNQKAFAEYFLIGTFTSFIWAAFFTFLYLKL